LSRGLRIERAIEPRVFVGKLAGGVIAHFVGPSRNKSSRQSSSAGSPTGPGSGSIFGRGFSHVGRTRGGPLSHKSRGPYSPHCVQRNLAAASNLRASSSSASCPHRHVIAHHFGLPRPGINRYLGRHSGEPV
jgi:hypothetical protein